MRASVSGSPTLGNVKASKPKLENCIWSKPGIDGCQCQGLVLAAS